ncbi:MAG: permease [Deltaproteobacteria bacterium]|jgi:uncharacterized membrane protein YraQ (UPF0718 family)|nr:permease [Deltaproteobacteria bacterium]
MFWNEMLRISNFMLEAFWHIWPYLVVTIPLAVAVQMSGASKYIKRTFQAQPMTAIALATVVGAFSPFCSCGVIPVIASLLISGVPLAPVMSFWIASPSMDPEIFFLSVGMIGWDLAVWRLIATLVLSFSAGLITQVLVNRGWLGRQILRSPHYHPAPGLIGLLKNGRAKFSNYIQKAPLSKSIVSEPVPIAAFQTHLMAIDEPSRSAHAGTGSPMCTSCESDPPIPSAPLQNLTVDTGAAATQSCCSSIPQESDPGRSSDTFRMRLLKETTGATWMVAKFMALAFLLEGLITLYVPEGWIAGILGSGNPLNIITAALLGVPAYTTSLSALPMISGLLTQGMNPAAALAFLVAGPVTTLPAMAAVWPLVVRRVFILYVAFALAGAVLIGYVYSFLSALSL